MTFKCNYWYAVTAVIGSAVQHGFHIGIVNIPEDELEMWIASLCKARSAGREPDEHQVHTIWSTIVGLYSVGGIIGACLTYVFAEKCGRREGILWSNVIMVPALSALMYAFKADSYELLMVGRLLAGITSGINSGLGQIYLIEIAPTKSRGKVGSCYQLGIVCSILLAQVTGICLGKNWMYMFIVPIFPMIYQFLTLPCCPNSPRFLLFTRNDEIGAMEALAWFRGTKNIKDEFEELQKEAQQLNELPEVTFKTMFTDRILRISLIVAFTIHVSQELCGINTVIYFSTDIFQYIDMDGIEHYLTLGIGIMNTLTTIVALYFMDSMERRNFLFWSYLILAVDTALLCALLVLAGPKDSHVAVNISAIVLVMSFVIIFAPALGCITWFISAELFPHTSRALAITMTVPFNWMCNMFIGQTFLLIKAKTGYYIYIAFIVTDVIAAVVVRKWLLPTTRRTSNEIIEFYKHQ